MISLLNKSVTTSQFIKPLFQSTPFRNDKDELTNNVNHGNQDEKDGGFMCFECAEMFDSQAELNEHAKTHVVVVNHNSPKSTLRNLSPYEKDSSLDSSIWSISSSDQLGRSSNADSLEKSGPNNTDTIDFKFIKSSQDGKVRTLSPDVNKEATGMTSLVGKKQFTITVMSSTSEGGDLNYICPVCGKSYINRDSLSKHLEVHAGFVCSICGKSYTTKSNLQTHMRKHNGEDKPFNCTHCEKTFTSLSVLRVHLRTHTGEKPFECPTCGVSFAKNIHLRRHLSIHTGIKPHECNICKKRFSRSDHLKRHVQSIHTQDRPHICSLCGKDFVRKYELNKHMKQLHWGFTVGEKNSDQSLNIPSGEEKSVGSSKIQSELVKESVS
ncbi:hypothetical protein KUTeg_016810 [Tegillarca granosa]|uniref:C2H2-type domain-containing protein n=1 Tax=Tegillarca granosa TaxID=220873 RepID=A0ABQ9ERT6_TEGGR|nr:hypothetical protein KUTeg_016810 [Tegillarca granosa]